MEEKKFKIRIFSFSFLFLLVCFCVAIIFYKEEFHIEQIEFKENKIKEQDDCFTIEQYTVSDSEISVSIIYDDPTNPESLNEYILLKDTESELCYQIPTEVYDHSTEDGNGNVITKKDNVYGYVSEGVDFSKNYEIYLLNENDDQYIIIPLNLSTKGDASNG